MNQVLISKSLSIVNYQLSIVRSAHINYHLNIKEL